jgi:hypothetical protein
MFEVERDLVLVLRQRVISSGKPEILDPQSVEWRTFRHRAVFFSQIPVPFGVVGVVHRAVLLAPGRMLKFNSELWFQNWYGRRSGMKKAASVGGLIVSEGSGLFARWERGLLVVAHSPAILADVARFLTIGVALLCVVTCGRGLSLCRQEGNAHQGDEY